jgi:hypothetical protein
MSDDTFFEGIAAETSSDPERKAPARLKSQVYTSLVRAQQTEGPLESLTGTKQAGRDLCVFEELVEITPMGAQAKTRFYCSVCHARFLAEHLENAPIWWPHCPYAEFQKP